MDEYDEGSSLDELYIEGSLFDDIWLGGDHDDVDMFFLSFREFFPEPLTDMYSIIWHYLIHEREYKRKEIFGKNIRINIPSSTETIVSSLFQPLQISQH
jgi:hypothetical protein